MACTMKAVAKLVGDVDATCSIVEIYDSKEAALEAFAVWVEYGFPPMNSQTITKLTVTFEEHES